MRRTTRYCKVHSKTSRDELMLRAFNTEVHRKTSKEKAQIDVLEKKTHADFRERKTPHSTSRKKAQRGTSKKKVRPGASHKKVYPSENGTKMRRTFGQGQEKYGLWEEWGSKMKQANMCHVALIKPRDLVCSKCGPSSSLNKSASFPFFLLHILYIAANIVNCIYVTKLTMFWG